MKSEHGKMKYYLIAGEASGDLHASHLIKSLKKTVNLPVTSAVEEAVALTSAVVTSAVEETTSVAEAEISAEAMKYSPVETQD